MLRFAIATVATFGLLMFISGSVTANNPGLGMIAEGIEGFEELAVTGEVYHDQGGQIPATVSCTGAFTATANVDAFSGTFSASVDAAPGESGYVTITASINGETVSKTVYVESVAGGGSGGPF